MTHAYTPGLRLAEKLQIRKSRNLPLPGDVIVKKGDTVKSGDIVAMTKLPGKVHAVNVINRLAILPSDLRKYMLKKEGDSVVKDEPIAETRPFIKMFKSICLSPISGNIESISDITGQVLLREPPKPVQINAYVDGKVVETMENEGVVIETTATFIQGIFGIGGETTGELQVVVNSPDDVLKPEDINEAHRGKIIAGGSIIYSDAIRKALDTGVKGIVVGGIRDKEINELLGYDLGVAITGSEDINITIIITEGFGQIGMAQKTFDLLKQREGSVTSINGATQIRAGVVRPEIIIPYNEEDTSEMSSESGSSTGEQSAGLSIGDQIRIIRNPNFGMLGKVKALPSELQTIETEAMARVLEVEFPDGQTAIVPRANIEAIEG
ncbi:MAG: hypothetical protein K8F52_00435 [Candidatus Scalindua rubra]|uniref:KOW domain-containing protein n=1 Tax=Candidatus Scalindua brodae TaxID=237368 RepID=A0A0B0EGH3_9BACT|nr:MAG: hypothetical protein SCABRO_03017 [Candidatus Scalindua brodae]MBZ0107106.1 hypothetical protein [Candidatus Scalindua rubra]TWU38126.1 hypothetical protein S225a_01730 [Candidatus Brocadiaceae bacterium S225]